jgi:hypothetical protein
MPRQIGHALHPGLRSECGANMAGFGELTLRETANV